ncbi:MAG: ATP-binding protein [Deltaproteobacteria bacterium]|nr:ATP-binding protein [Deltaproteobacteria bacterium]
MQRAAERRLSLWIESKRRKPLVLRGARQVGKSTLVRQFAAQKGLTLNEINLERWRSLDQVFATLDTSIILTELEAIVGRSLSAPGSLLFLDELQATPHALQALRYLFEDLPALPVIAAGSLLEFTLSDHSFSMPVGRISYHHLGPMTFREFLYAVKPELCRYLDELSFDARLPDLAHQQLLQRQRQYLFVGGMPEAVLAYIESGSLAEATSVHNSIVSTYEDDFAKYARQKQLALLQRVFHLIPMAVGKKVKYVNFSREDRSRDVKGAIEMLAKARVCCQVFASHCSGIPLIADIKTSTYKLLFLDVGLMNHIGGLDWLTLQQMDEVRLVNEGALAEQFVGQHLAYPDLGLRPPQPVYWLREGRTANAELDYVVSSGPLIVPVEVKAGKSGSLRSLHQFISEKKVLTAVRFDTNKPSRQTVSHPVRTKAGDERVEYELLSLPLYAVSEIDRLLDQQRKSSR